MNNGGSERLSNLWQKQEGLERDLQCQASDFGFCLIASEGIAEDFWAGAWFDGKYALGGFFWGRGGKIWQNQWGLHHCRPGWGTLGLRKRGSPGRAEGLGGRRGSKWRRFSIDRWRVNNGLAMEGGREVVTRIPVLFLKTPHAQNNAAKKHVSTPELNLCC